MEPTQQPGIDEASDISPVGIEQESVDDRLSRLEQINGITN